MMDIIRLSIILLVNILLLYSALCQKKSQQENRTITYDTRFNKTEIQPRIKNGTVATLKDVPYLVSFKKDLNVITHPGYYFTFCGGTLIKPSKVLTAAHCFMELWLYFGFIRKKRKVSLSNIIAVMGCIQNGLNLTDLPDGQLRSPKKILIHRRYSFPHKDIAIVLMNIPFQLNDHVKTIYFARSFKDYKGTCLIAGFGNTTKNEKGQIVLPPYLNIGRTELMSAAECSKRMHSNADGLICANSTPSDTTKGDSGGPLVCKGTEEEKEDPTMGILVGIVSGGYDFSFYTRVSKYVELIESTAVKNHVLKVKLLPTFLMIILFNFV